MNYPDSVQFLYSLGNEITTAKLGLERIGTLLEALGNPQRVGRFIHVAGTNGKGSTCAMIESGLRAAGYYTGRFTSPHLLEPLERICIAGEPVSRQEFASAFNQVHEAAGQLLHRNAIDLHPTYFETVTAMAFLIFAQKEVDVVVLEVGLGGRLDATNVVTPLYSVITPIDFDHEAWLGRSLEAIAGEKAGIIKTGGITVIAEQRPEAARVLWQRSTEVNSSCIASTSWAIGDLSLTPRGSTFTLTYREQTMRITCPLAGEHQVENARTAAAVLQLFGLPPADIEAGIRQARWPGRLELVASQPDIILDGAHNPAGARALRAYIKRFYNHRKVWLIYGAMRDKAVAEMAGILFPLADEVIVTAPKQNRAVRPESILELAEHSRIRAVPTLAEALGCVRATAAPADVVFVTGSLFLVAEAR